MHRPKRYISVRTLVAASMRPPPPEDDHGADHGVVSSVKPSSDESGPVSTKFNARTEKSA